MSAEQLMLAAMTLLRQGRASDAVRLISDAPMAVRNGQAAQRTLAAAYAEAGDLTAAQTAIDCALHSPPIDAATMRSQGASPSISMLRNVRFRTSNH